MEHNKKVPQKFEGTYLSKFKKERKGVPIVAQQKQIRLGTMRFRVQSLASLSGLRIRRCHELWCRLQTWLRSGVAVNVVEAGGYSSDLTPSLEISICRRNSPEKKKKSVRVFISLYIHVDI